MKMTTHGNNHYEMELAHGRLHVFANPEVFQSFESRVYEMADNNLRIPRNMHMSYTPDAHVGIGTCIGTTAVWTFKDGFVSPSIVGVDIGCGMRVHTTSLHKKDIQDKGVRRALIKAIEKYVPTNERTNTHYADIDIMEVVKHGLKGLPQSYIPSEQWLTHVEESTFQFDHVYLESLPEKIGKYAHGQLGTLGGGNHFIEIQYLEVAEKHQQLAAEWGLFDGQVVVMIHSGSRAWGARLGQEFTKVFREAMQSWGIENPDKNLLYAPISIPGSMGTSSFIMVGREEGVKNFYSICHGAGRARSRKATKELVTVDEFAQSLKVGTEEEILVNHRSLQTILDECPQAYKDVDLIIDSVVGASLADVVATCKPMVAIKGV